MHTNSKHGLFSQTDEKINLDEVADEVSNHNGIVWTHVISLKREDAERLGYGYLPKSIKETVNSIVAELAKDKNLAKLYSKWNEINREKLSLYYDKEKPDILLEDNKEFRSIKNYILKSVNLILQTTPENEVDNSDIDLENRVMHLNRGVKEISKRDGVTAEKGREVKVGKLKSATSKRDVPLNDTAIEMIIDLRKEFYFGEDSPLIPDENGNFTRPVNFRKRYYRILKAAGIETKGLHSLRHTFATNLVNGIKQPDGSIKSLTPRQVADLLGHTTSEITEMYYVKRDLTKLNGITDEFNL